MIIKIREDEEQYLLCVKKNYQNVMNRNSHVKLHKMYVFTLDKIYLTVINIGKRRLDYIMEYVQDAVIIM